MSKVQDLIIQLASFGRQKDGACSRPFGSLAYREAALFLYGQMKEEGLNSYIDSVGNVHGIYEGNTKNGKELLIGSHLDTVKEGGIFDGLYGVAAGLAVILRLKEENIKLPFSIHLIATNGEEGNKLGGTFGSRCLVGKFSKEDWDAYLRKEPKEDLFLTEEKHALDFEDIKRAYYDFSKTMAYLELHIEQGITLEKQNKEIGIVTGIVGLRRYVIRVGGNRNHSGTTMMEYRDDALVKAAKIIVQADKMARNIGQNFVATMQTIKVSPNALAVINGEAEMILETRNLDEKLLDYYENQLEEYVQQIPKTKMKRIVAKQPVIADRSIRDQMIAACEREGVSYLELPSGATHDGNMMALKTRVGMLFVPSKDGISHDKAEWTDSKYIDKGTDLLYSVVKYFSEE